MKLTLIAVLTLTAGCCEAAAGDDRPVPGTALVAQFAGRTIYLAAPFGTLPITYNRDGTMAAQSKALAVYTGVARDTGTWRISGNKVCQRWRQWNNGEEQCFTVRANGATIHWTTVDGQSGTATVGR